MWEDGLKCFSEAGFCRLSLPGWLQRVLLTCVHQRRNGDSAKRDRPCGLLQAVCAFRGDIKEFYC